MSFALIAGHALEYERIDADPAKPVPAKPDPAKPVLVFLHEGLGSIGQWRDFPRALVAATGCPALVYSRYGYGQSDVLAEPRTPRFMHDEALVALPELLAVLGIAAPILVGHSDGASIALIHAGAGNPARAVVVEAPHVFVEAHGLRAIRAARQAFADSDLRERLANYHRDAEKTFYGWNDVWLSEAFRSWNIETALRSVRCPVLAIQGEDDAYGTMAQLETIAREVDGPCELVKLSDCGHAPHREQPERTLAAVSGFVKAVLQGDPR